MVTPPILDNKSLSSPSMFEPRILLREARRQKRLPATDVPAVCVLDPDGDIVRMLRQTGNATAVAEWPCYHTELDSVTSAGQIVLAEPPPYFVVIDRALRDEGTSYNYAAPAEFAEADPELISAAVADLKRQGLSHVVGASWTTDAPFRETVEAVESARARGILAVEMEAAALYAFARAKAARILCVAHVTNTMGRAGRDFEKGDSDGARDALRIVEAIADALHRPR